MEQIQSHQSPIPEDDGYISSYVHAPTFHCQGCNSEVPLTKRSWDHRYCRSCCSFLMTEARNRVGIPEAKGWVPRQSPAPVDLWFEEGDRVQLLDSRHEDGILDEWMMVSSVVGMVVTVFVGTKVKRVPLARVVAHHKADYFRSKNCKEDNTMTKKINPTPSENYVRIKQVLEKLTTDNADPRIIGLWKTKLAHAEAICKEAGIDPEALESDAVAVAPVTEQPVESGTIPATEVPATDVPATDVPTTQPALERVGDELPPETKAVLALPKKQRPQVKPNLPKKTPKPPTTPRSNVLCLCGCGSQTSKGSDFCQGHDARLGSYLRKLDAGTIKLDSLPEPVQKMVADNHPVIVRLRSHIARKHSGER